MFFMNLRDSFLTTILSYLTISLCMYESGASLIVTNTGPAVIGANVTITVEITDYSDYYDFYLTWSDNAGHGKVTTPAFEKMSWNVTYSQNANVDLYIEVAKKLIIVTVKTERATTSFKVSDTIPGDLKIEQNGMELHPQYVSTRNETNISFVLHDPTGFFKGAYFNYMWNIYPGEYDLPSSDKIAVNFTSAAEKYHVYLSVFTYINERTFTGQYEAIVSPRDPIYGLNITGNLWLKHGEVLKLKAECKGSPQFRYCWRFRVDAVNKTEEKCAVPTVTNYCEFYIIHYFNNIGNYKTVIIIDNDIDHNVQVLDVNIFKVARKSQLSIIVIPVVCSVLVLGIIVFGISFYIQNRKRLRIEEANFDFQASDSVEYRTFFRTSKR